MRRNLLIGALFFAITGSDFILPRLWLDHRTEHVGGGESYYKTSTIYGPPLSDFGEWKLLFGTLSDDDINEWRQLYGAFLDAPDYSEGTSAIIWAMTNPYSVQYGATCSMNTGFAITSSSGSGTAVFIGSTK